LTIQIQSVFLMNVSLSAEGLHSVTFLLDLMYFLTDNIGCFVFWNVCVCVCVKEEHRIWGAVVSSTWPILVNICQTCSPPTPFFFFFAVLKMDPRALCMLDKCSVTELHPFPLAFWHKVLPCSLGWPQTHNSLTSDSRAKITGMYHYIGLWSLLPFLLSFSVKDMHAGFESISSISSYLNWVKSLNFSTH
jgi:hypothetical protein